MHPLPTFSLLSLQKSNDRVVSAAHVDKSTLVRKAEEKLQVRQLCSCQSITETLAAVVDDQVTTMSMDTPV